MLKRLTIIIIILSLKSIKNYEKIIIPALSRNSDSLLSGRNFNQARS